MNYLYQYFKLFFHNELDDLVDFWFNNPKLWFNSTLENDKIISDKYKHLLNKEINNKNSSVGLILLYDQVSRHVFRNNKLIIEFYSNIALEHTYNLLEYIENYKPEERCFILMPLRHTFQKENILLCIDYINKWTPEKIYNRFYQASIQSLIKLNNNNTEYKIDIIKIKYDKILDPKSIKQIFFSYDDNIYNETLYHEFSKNLSDIDDNNIIISISGGVDSMVCSFLLYYYCNKNNKIPIGATINYCNREDQNLEIDVVNIWLQKLNIKHHVRIINELSRTRDKNRDFYEKITREIRFDFYKKLNGSVILGHNKDDSLENIFSNIKKKKSYDNLFGMSIYSKEKNVNIYRPLLNINKKTIIDFANKYNIPYVYDSTPSWSERGKMRDILIPQIESFNKDILEGLIELANNYKEIYRIYKELSVPEIIFKDFECIIINKNIYFLDYWKNIINNIICKHYNIKIVTNKSITNMLKNIQLETKITLNKHICCQLKNNIITFYIF